MDALTTRMLGGDYSDPESRLDPRKIREVSRYYDDKCCIVRVTVEAVPIGNPDRNLFYTTFTSISDVFIELNKTFTDYTLLSGDEPVRKDYTLKGYTEFTLVEYEWIVLDCNLQLFPKGYALELTEVQIKAYEREFNWIHSYNDRPIIGDRTINGLRLTGDVLTRMLNKGGKLPVPPIILVDTWSERDNALVIAKGRPEYTREFVTKYTFEWQILMNMIKTAVFEIHRDVSHKIDVSVISRLQGSEAVPEIPYASDKIPSLVDFNNNVIVMSPHMTSCIPHWIISDGVLTCDKQYIHPTKEEVEEFEHEWELVREFNLWITVSNIHALGRISTKIKSARFSPAVIEKINVTCMKASSLTGSLSYRYIPHLLNPLTREVMILSVPVNGIECDKYWCIIYNALSYSRTYVKNSISVSCFFDICNIIERWNACKTKEEMVAITIAHTSLASCVIELMRSLL